MKDLYFAVEGGKTLELAKQYVKDRTDQHERNVALAKELGAEQFYVSFLDGRLTGVRFEGKSHPGFKKPDRKGISFPKKGSEWGNRIKENPGHDARGYDLAEALGVPTVLKYESDDRHGSSVISPGFNSGVGFLYLSEDGPFALYVPDISEKVAYYEGQGYTVDDACKNFTPQFDGSRPILKEEWELTVAKHKLAEATRAAS